MFSARPVELYMVPLGEYLTVRENEKVHSALKVLNDSIHRGGAWQGPRLLVVLNDGGDPTGVLTLKSMIGTVGLKLLEDDPFFRSECFSWYYIKKVREHGVSVREVMRPLGLFSLDCRGTVREAARIFARHGINHLPVTRRNTAVGILSKWDLFYRYYESTGFLPVLERGREARAPVQLAKDPAGI